MREFRADSAKLTACTEDLTRAAQVINHKLHKKQNQDDGFDVDIDEESKNTRRNSQYKSMALNIMWYFAYKHANGGRDPPAPPERESAGDNNAVAVTTKRAPPACDNEKKDHYTKFNNADYTMEMVIALKNNMSTLVAFAYDEYCAHLQVYMKDHMNVKKAPAVGTPLQSDSKVAHILSKLYCAILLETDLEELFKLILHKLKTKYCKYQINKLLQAAVDCVCTRYLPLHERSVHVEKMKNSLKSEELQTVALRMLDWGRKLKYSIFPMVDSVQDDDVTLLDIKKFETHRRNTDTIYYYSSPVPLNLKVENYDRKYGAGVVVLVEFSCPARHTKFIYDCLSHPQHAKETLATLSWKQRLDLVLNVSSEINVPTINVEEITVEQLQFENYPGGHNNYHYIRTGGFGCGTSFIRSVPGHRKRSARQSSLLNKRHKKVKLEDLSETEVHASGGIAAIQQQELQLYQQHLAYQQAAAVAAAAYHHYSPGRLPAYYGYVPPPPLSLASSPPPPLIRSPSPVESLFSLDLRTAANRDAQQQPNGIGSMLDVVIYEPPSADLSTPPPVAEAGGYASTSTSSRSEVVYDI